MHAIKHTALSGFEKTMWSSNENYRWDFFPKIRENTSLPCKQKRTLIVAKAI